MPRCGSCPACSLLAAFKESNKGPSGRNKIRKKAKEYPCANPTASTKKRPISEIDSLFSTGHGGQIRGETMPPPTQSELHLERSDRAARPKNLAEEPISSLDDFDRY